MVASLAASRKLETANAARLQQNLVRLNRLCKEAYAIFAAFFTAFFTAGVAEKYPGEPDQPLIIWGHYNLNTGQSKEPSTTWIAVFVKRNG